MMFDVSGKIREIHFNWTTFRESAASPAITFATLLALASSGAAPGAAAVAAFAGGVGGAVVRSFHVEETDSLTQTIQKFKEAILKNAGTPASVAAVLQEQTSAEDILLRVLSPSFEEDLILQVRMLCRDDPKAYLFPEVETIRTAASMAQRLVRDGAVGDGDFSNYLKRLTEYKNIPHTDNSKYANQYFEPMFLHRDVRNSPVRLENLFVMPKYTRRESEAPQNDLPAVLTGFLQDNGKRVLLIEGDAAVGKTTLAVWMNALYACGLDRPLRAALFGDRPLVTVRLRDIETDDLKGSGSHLKDIGCFPSAIMSYLGFAGPDSYGEFIRSYPRAVLLLDGFDELCMVENIAKHHAEMLNCLFRKNWDDVKFIVTSRPAYIRGEIDVPHEKILLHHFDEAQREKWLARYTVCSSETLSEKVQEFIRNPTGAAADICNTPMTLYMLAASGDAERYLNNPWELYHHIFHEALSETEYNNVFQSVTSSYTHPVEPYRDVLYRISEEIAFRMYQNGNQTLYLGETEISGIIEELKGNDRKMQERLSDQSAQTIVGHCYALCCYWKPYSERGAVEFLHNNIRDFFLCEKIVRELNENTETVQRARMGNREAALEAMTRQLAKLFRYGKLQDQVLEFLQYRMFADKKKDSPQDFAKYEYDHHDVARLLQNVSDLDLVSDGTLSRICMEYIKQIQSILYNMVGCYWHGYQSYLKRKGEEKDEEELTRHETIPWGKEGSSAETNAAVLFFEEVFGHGRLGVYGDFHQFDLRRANLRRAGLSGADLRGANLRRANLRRADLRAAGLSGADLIGADLRDADLRDADLRRADLRRADLRRANLGTAVFKTILPDGYQSASSEDLISHLKSLNIEGLKI